MSEDANNGYWRWFARPVWHHTSSMYQESYLASNAPHEFARYHHLRSCIYFCTAALEAFLNEKMRKQMHEAEFSEAEIYKKLRKGGILDKTKEWPEQLGTNLQLPAYILEHIEGMLEVRNEVTHPKNKDHSILKELDDLNPFWCVKSAAEYMVSFHEAAKEVYPFWLLGWNLVGCNHPAQSFEAANSYFIMALRNMGFNVPYMLADQIDEWEKFNMTSLSGFQKLYKVLEKNAPDIEPRNNHFPTAPRLTRRWWDIELIQK